MTGFTLVELMVVVSVFAVLVAAALPAYNDFVRNQRVKTASFELFSTLVLARSEALTRNSTVTVTPTSGTNNWATGWEVKAGTLLLRKQDTLSAITMAGTPDPVTSISFNGSGRIAAALNRGIQISATGASITTRCIKIDTSGRPLTKAEAC